MALPADTAADPPVDTVVAPPGATMVDILVDPLTAEPPPTAARPTALEDTAVDMAVAIAVAADPAMIHKWWLQPLLQAAVAPTAGLPAAVATDTATQRRPQAAGQDPVQTGSRRQCPSLAIWSSSLLFTFNLYLTCSLIHIPHILPRYWCTK